MKTKRFQKAGSFEQCSKAKLLEQQRILGALSDLVEKKKCKTRNLGDEVVLSFNHTKMLHFFCKNIFIPTIFLPKLSIETGFCYINTHHSLLYILIFLHF